MKWSDVIGQEQVKDRLRTLADQQRVPHAMLFCGPTGCGKMATALAFASYLLGERDADSPESRRTETMLKKWEHPDLHFSYPTIKAQKMSSDHQPTSLDFIREWREMITRSPYFTMEEWMNAMGAEKQQAIITGAESDDLARALSLKSSQGGYKISVIWLPERMNQTSANKLLKLLEEPPRQTVFIMVSEQPEQLLDTIRSRTQRVDFKKISHGEMEQALISRRKVDEKTARRITRIANGNWDKALGELNVGNENLEFLEMFKSLMRLSYMRKVNELKKWSEIASGYGREKQKRMLQYFSHMIRENFIYNFHEPGISYMTQEEENFSKNFARFINEANVVEISMLLDKAIRDISQNANGKIVFFDLTLKMIVLLIRK